MQFMCAGNVADFWNKMPRKWRVGCAYAAGPFCSAHRAAWPAGRRTVSAAWSRWPTVASAAIASVVLP